MGNGRRTVTSSSDHCDPGVLLQLLAGIRTGGWGMFVMKWGLAAPWLAWSVSLAGMVCVTPVTLSREAGEAKGH